MLVFVILFCMVTWVTRDISLLDLKSKYSSKTLIFHANLKNGC